MSRQRGSARGSAIARTSSAKGPRGETQREAWFTELLMCTAVKGRGPSGVQCCLA